MDLARTGFTTPIVGTASFKVEVDANGNLVTAEGGAVAAGSKRISFSNVKADASYASIVNVFIVFSNELPGADYMVEPYGDETTFTVKWGV